MKQFTFIPMQATLPATLGISEAKQRRFNDIALEYERTDITPAILNRIAGVCETNSEVLYAGFVLATARHAGDIERMIANPFKEQRNLQAEAEDVAFEMMA